MFLSSQLSCTFFPFPFSIHFFIFILCCANVNVLFYFSVSFRDYNCFGPIGKLTLQRGCSQNPLVHKTCIGYTQSFCETSFPLHTPSLLPPFPPLPRANALLPTRHSRPTRDLPASLDLRSDPKIVWLFVQKYADRECTSSITAATGYPVNACIQAKSGGSFYYQYFGDSSYVTYFTCAGLSCGMSFFFSLYSHSLTHSHCCGMFFSSLLTRSHFFFFFFLLKKAHVTLLPIHL